MFLPSFLLCLLFTVLDPAAGYDVKFFPAPEQDKDPQIYYMNMFLHTERQVSRLSYLDFKLSVVLSYYSIVFIINFVL